MRFYHAFPQPESTSRTKIETLGLSILESIFRYGLLLTEESLYIPPNPYPDAPSPPSTTVLQYRACFTLLRRDELLLEGGHTKQFGRFAIGLDTREARQLGIVPVLYYYRDGKASGSMLDAAANAEVGEMSMEVLYRLAEVRRLLIVLAYVEAKAGSSRRKYKPIDYLERHGLHLADEPKVAAAIAHLTPRQARMIMPLIATERVSACNLAEWIEIILSMFQTADSSTDLHHLAYFAEREWRIVQAYSESIICLPMHREKRMLLSSTERRFVERCCDDLEHVITRLGLSLNPASSFLIAGTRVRHFRDFIVEVIVPSNLASSALSLLEDIDRRPWLENTSDNGFAVLERRLMI